MKPPPRSARMTPDKRLLLRSSMVHKTGRYSPSFSFLRKYSFLSIQTGQAEMTNNSGGLLFFQEKPFALKTAHMKLRLMPN